MPKSANKLTTDQLGRLIYEIRGRRVLLDADLAAIYGVTHGGPKPGSEAKRGSVSG